LEFLIIYLHWGDHKQIMCSSLLMELQRPRVQAQVVFCLDIK
jgi:hypothetical protein